jgi:YD repeat-containing protein
LTSSPLHAHAAGGHHHDHRLHLRPAPPSDGGFFHFSYDAVGNRLTESSDLGRDGYVYDAADPLTSVNGVAYQWDANGNLLSEGAATYAYDHADRMVEVQQAASTYAFAYNGLGDRLQQTVQCDDSTPLCTSYAPSIRR